MSSIPSRTLAAGDTLPIVGFGTWDLSEADVHDVLPTALDNGYTHVDTAEGYQNEEAIGEVIAEYERDDLFLTSKVLPSHLHYESLLDALARSLERLGTEYLDLYLIHWPNPAISIRNTLRALERAHEQGLIRNVGVSNFSRYQLQFARRIANVPIVANQIEFHPWYVRQDLLDYCQEHDIVVEAAAPLARTTVLEDPVIREIADSHDVMPAQVALRWAVEKDVVVLPKSTNPDHIRANLDLFDWSLDTEDMERIDQLDRQENVYMIDLDDEVYGVPA
ncbi:oxidoreductase [Salinibacter sp. 10B]|uniref:aldo/keto reductase n=1 Tax=Salinibacter sp. 10B TaxID=1923971 RepID=UPI000CF4891B|nr:aldo/keto reductase [Salinibacter sp. 10B]PQJ35035.1 oxidoreductase [Salinibacter sp. 10B]